MRRNRSERGESQMGCLVGVILLLVAIFLAYKIIPVKVKATALKQTVTDMSKSAGQYDDARILKAILDTAQREGLPVGEDDVLIQRTNNSSMMKIEVKYQVPIKFPGYTHNWKFHHKVENPIF